MSQTAVGLFVNASEVDEVVLELQASNFRRQEIRLLREPSNTPETGIMGHLSCDFEVRLQCDLRAMGASVWEANVYAQRIRRGDVLVLASGSDLEVENASEIMNRHGAVVVREMTGAKPDLSGTMTLSTPPTPADSSQTGRIRQSSGGARMFVW